MKSSHRAVNHWRPSEVDGVWARLWQLLLPWRCQLCGAAAQAPLELCPPCLHQLPWLTCACPICAEPLAEDSPCGACLAHPPAFTRTIVALRYGPPLDRLLQGFKFHQRLASGRLLSRILADAVLHDDAPLPDCLIPVPLHPRRLRQRGFNQAAVIANDLGCWLQRPVAAHCLRRVRHTPAQSGLSLDQRQRNLRRAFVAQGPLPAHVALIDDVITTTSTVRACARELAAAGARRIDVWALARTP